jgi:hypothetical protein
MAPCAWRVKRLSQVESRGERLRVFVAQHPAQGLKHGFLVAARMGLHSLDLPVPPGRRRTQRLRHPQRESVVQQGEAQMEVD